MKVPRDRLATPLQPGQIVDELLRVCGVAERTASSGRASFCTMSRGDANASLATIVGPEALDLVLGQSVRVQGCVLVRRGRPILVISRLRPCSQRTA